MSEQNSNESTTLDALIIGAGFSGVCAAIKLLENGIRNFRVYEKSAGVGGTWYDNTYPGAACDVPSHFYCYSFEPNPNWSRIYSPQAEIQQYIEHCVDKYDVRPHLVHNSNLTSLVYIENAAVWEAVFEDGQRVRARHVISGAGGLHKPSIPDFPGRDSYAGVSMHTARWDHSVDLQGKNVAVIGSAASAIQVIPEAAKVASSVTVFQRTPNYIVPRGDRDYSDREKRRFARWPWFGRMYRWIIKTRMDVLLFPLIKKDSARGVKAASKINQHMRASVKDSDLQNKLEPDYALGCKRILLSDDLYAAFNRDNVEVVTDGIEAIDATGIATRSGNHYNADIIVYATGFDIEGHLKSLNIIGENGRSLNDTWENGSEAFNGTCVAGFPNYFMITGPNTGVATTSVVYMVEQSVDYIIRLIGLANSGQSIAVRKDVQDNYNEVLQAQMCDRVWVSGCKSWYLDENGRISTLYPNNAGAFKKQLRHINAADYVIHDAAGSAASGS